jgi:iron-sulfur cluster repair protein YtfE (RIC family)
VAGKNFKLDMTMMYAAHDAFRRELGRLARITARGADDPQRILSTAAGWEMFKTYLRLHHTSEDQGLWPTMLPALASQQDDIAMLEALEAEHQAIDPMLGAIDEALADRDAGPRRLGELLDTLSSRVSQHLSHEEREGLPLIDRTLSEEQWQFFSELHRKRMSAHVTRYLPWLLDSVPEDQAAAILALLPEPVRLAYQNEWQVAYGQLELWGGGGNGRANS